MYKNEGKKGTQKKKTLKVTSSCEIFSTKAALKLSSILCALLTVRYFLREYSNADRNWCVALLTYTNYRMAEVSVSYSGLYVECGGEISACNNLYYKITQQFDA